MSNRFERGYVPPQPIKRRTTGGVQVKPAVATQAETNLVPLAGAMVNVYTLAEDEKDPEWSDTDDFFTQPSGQVLSRTDYATLYGRLGVVWGVGDGATTFNVPNVLQTSRQPFFVSVSPTVYTAVGTYGSGNMGEHPHTFSNRAATYWYDGTGGDQRGPRNENNYPTISGQYEYGLGYREFPGVELYQQPGQIFHQPKFMGLRSYMCTQDGGGTLPLGYTFSHLSTVADAATILGDYDTLLIASGQTIPAADYPDFVAAYGATLPDLTGRFMRQDIAMASGFSPEGRGLPVNSTYIAGSDAYASHFHVYPGNTSPGLRCLDSVSQSSNTRNYNPSPTGAWNQAGKSSPYGVGPGNELRPYNISVLYFIKVKR
tara:strand:- start:4 stop:1119 length:1116 start_codon:yes stop_codon:yes gene_type:complete